MKRKTFVGIVALVTSIVVLCLSTIGVMAAQKNLPLQYLDDTDVLDAMYATSIEYTSVSVISGFKHVSNIGIYYPDNTGDINDGVNDDIRPTRPQNSNTADLYHQVQGAPGWYYEINDNTKPSTKPALRYSGGVAADGTRFDTIMTLEDWTYQEPTDCDSWEDTGCYNQWILDGGTWQTGVQICETWRALSDTGSKRPQNINIHTNGLSSLEISVKFVRSGTNTPISLTGHMTNVDLDLGQKFGFGGGVNAVYIADNNPYLWKEGNLVVSEPSEGFDNDPERYKLGLVETTYSGSELEFYFVPCWQGIGSPQSGNWGTTESFFALSTDTIAPILPDEYNEQVHKSADKTSGVTVGDTIEYEVEFTTHEWGVNTRYGWTYDSLSIVDDLPSELSYVSGSGKAYIDGSPLPSSAGSFSASSGNVTYRFNAAYLESMNLSNARKIKIVFDAKLDRYPANGNMYIINGCHAVWNGTTSPGNDVRTDLIGAQMSLTKSPKTQHISGNDVTVGKQVTWTINVSNDGQVPITNINIDDKLPGATVNYGSWDKSLDAGEDQDVTVTYTLTKDDIVKGSVHNTAIATGDWANGDVTSNEDYADVTIDNSPKLTLEKTPKTQTVDGVDAVIGHVVNWKIKVTNTGNVPLTNVTIDDKLDGAVVNTSGFDGNLAVGASQEFDVTYHLTKDDIVRGTVDNVAIAHGDWVGGTPVDSNEDTAHVDIENDPELTLTKDPKSQTIDDEHAVPGTPVSWTITVENTGQVEISNITVDESALPGCTVSPSSPVTLAPGESKKYTATYKITQADIDAETVHNVAIAHGEWVGGPVDSNEDTADVDIDAVPHVTIEKTADSETIDLADAHPGTVINYSFLITNDGHQTLDDVEINDSMPNVEELTIDWSTSTDKSTGDGKLAPNETVRGSASYTITQADIDSGRVVNTAIAETTDPSDEPTPSDPDEVETVIETKDELTIEKTVDKEVIEGDEIVPGTLLTYTFVITNTGNRTVNDVTIEDQLDGIDGPVIDWSTSTDETTGDGTLLPSESVTATATYQLTQHDIDMAEVINVAIAHGTNPNGDPVDSEPDDAETVIDVHDELVLEKVVDKTELSDDEMFVGQVLNYSFTLVNNGDRTVHDVQFEDYLQGLSDIIVDWEGSSDIETGDGVLSPDEVVTATAMYTITQNDIDNCQVTNTAIVHSKLPNEDPFDSNESTVTTIINASAEFIIEKQVDKAELKGDEAVPGTTLNYTFHLTNNGDRTIRNVELEDYLEGVYDIVIDWSTSTNETTGEGTLSPGEMVDASGKYDITQADIDAGKVVNTVIAHGTLGGEYDPNQKPASKPDDDANENVNDNENTSDNENADGNENINDNENIVAEPDADGDGVADDNHQDDIERIDSNESTVQTVIEQNPHLSLTKVADKEHIDPAYPDDVITYTFTVTNDGNVTLKGVNIVDDLNGISEIEYDWIGSSTGDNTLAPGESATATATYAITQQDLDAGEVVNTATAHGAAPDNSDVASDQAETRTTLVDGNAGVASDLISTQDLIQTGAMVGGGIAAVAATAGIAAITSHIVRNRKRH